MYSGFFSHSPLRAHDVQLGSSSTHSLVDLACGFSKDRTWIHLVADHFSPSMTGQLPCRLVLSVVASGWRLKNNSASPFLGFTVQRSDTRKPSYTMHTMDQQRLTSKLNHCWGENEKRKSNALCSLFHFIKHVLKLHAYIHRQKCLFRNFSNKVTVYKGFTWVALFGAIRQVFALLLFIFKLYLQ